MYIAKLPICFLSLLIAGCATTYAQPKKSEPHATANLIQSYGQHNYVKQFLSQGRHQVFQMMKEDNCTSPIHSASFHSGALDGNSKKRRLAVGTPLRIMSAVTIKDAEFQAYTSPIGEHVQTSTCGSIGRFTPLNGHSYDIKMDFISLNDCKLIVIDTDTNLPPDDLIVGHDKLCASE